MASSPSLLRSTTSSFHAQFTAVPTLHSVRLPKGNPRNRWDGLSVKAASIVLVDPAEATKVHRLKTHYLEKIVPLLKEEFAYTNIHEVPKVEKIVVNCGMGQAAQNEKGLDAAIKELASITAQKPMITRAKKAIATFKLREGQPTGIACTLRGKVMYSFLDRMINLGLPRTRDFQGVSPNSFDGQGNYNLGFKEQGVFPEIRADIIGKQRGMDVCIVTSAKTDKECFRLLALMGMPFREGGGQVNEVRKKKLKAHHFASKSKTEARR